jgi:hypothetical protein
MAQFSDKIVDPLFDLIKGALRCEEKKNDSDDEGEEHVHKGGFTINENLLPYVKAEGEELNELEIEIEE